MANINNPTMVKMQYGTSSNLDSRIYVKKLFSTCKIGWSDFLLQNFRLKPGQRILELGCGNAIFWQFVSDKIPEDTKLILSDLSSGMLDAAKNNTSELDFIEKYAIIDAQEIPYDDNSFDIVIANYMLYHVPDVDKALSEISRVLKPDGFFFAATFGKDNLREVDNIFTGFDAGIDAVANAMCNVFGIENGASYLEKHFDSVELKRYENGLHITEPDSLVNYFLSYRGMGNIGEVISDDKIPQFSDYITKVFSKNGYVDITQDEGLFISGIPKK